MSKQSDALTLALQALKDCLKAAKSPASKRKLQATIKAVEDALKEDEPRH
jgi:hypothetical protein